MGMYQFLALLLWVVVITGDGSWRVIPALLFAFVFTVMAFVTGEFS